MDETREVISSKATTESPTTWWPSCVMARCLGRHAGHVLVGGAIRAAVLASSFLVVDVWFTR